jgi:hypothetical protein
MDLMDLLMEYGMDKEEMHFYEEDTNEHLN